MGITCEISLKHGKDIYRAGDSVEGTVKYIIDKPIEIISIILSLQGKGLCFWVPITANTKYTESENYIDQRMDLLDTKEVEAVIIPTGTCEKPFCFVLPEEIASSYKDFRCFISFFIQLEFVESNPMCLTKKFYLDIPAQGGVKLRPTNECMLYNVEKELMFSNKVVKLKAIMEKFVLHAGEDITVAIDVSNHAEVQLLALKAELIEFVTYKSDRDQLKIISKALTGAEMKYLGAMKLETEHSVTQYISTKPQMFSTCPDTVRKEYGIIVTLKFPFPHRNLCLKIQVEIAEKTDDFEEKHMNVQEPECWQAMNEKNPLCEKLKNNEEVMRLYVMLKNI